MTKRDDLLKEAHKVIGEIQNTSKDTATRLKKDLEGLPDEKIISWMKTQTALNHAAAKQKSNVVATSNNPHPEQASKYDIPMKELLIGKAGVGDLYNKVNEQTRLINDLLKGFDIKSKKEFEKFVKSKSLNAKMS